MRTISTLILLLLAIAGGQAQSAKTIREGNTLRSVVVDGDTMPHIDIREVPILPKKVFKNRFEEKKYWRLVYNIRKVLPYSKIVAATVNQVESRLGSLPDDKARRKYMKQMEDSLWKEYEKDMRAMTITQGKLLFKLIDRETSNSTYYWIDSFRGSVSAFFWQGMARLFGTNLKSKYDPKGEDAVIEQIVTYIEKGYI